MRLPAVVVAIGCAILAVGCSPSTNSTPKTASNTPRSPSAPQNGVGLPSISSRASCDISQLHGVVSNIHRGTHSGEAFASLELSYSGTGYCQFGSGMGIELLTGSMWQAGALEIPTSFRVPTGVPRVHVLSWTWARAQGLDTLTVSRLRLTLDRHASTVMSGPNGASFTMEILQGHVLINP